MNRPKKRQPELAMRRGLLIRDLGLAPPTPGSLGWRYGATLLLGVGVAVWVGQLSSARAVADWMLLVSLVLWQPLVEELLFRGLLQGFLRRTPIGRRALAGVSAANVITSLAFVGVHFVNQPPLWALGVFFPSLLFGYFRDRTDSVWPPLVLHVTFNTAFFLA
jgi:membrane protease YdiL (CAAX protease family)